jgi:class 3 adenylate cyclase
MSRAGAVGASRTTATFLFTDIESHTPLWEAHPEVMADALATHDALLRDAVADAGGRVVKYGGDAVMAVFDDAAAAVAAAYVAQRALDETEWPRVGTLHVRMGLHTGARTNATATTSVRK